MPHTVNWKSFLDYAEVTDVGMRRSNNQDSKAVMLAPDPDLWRKRGHVFLVADGMGAHAAGELASKIAADTIPHTYHKLTLPPPNAIRKSIREVNATIHRRGQSNLDFQGMGTTASTLVLLPQGALVGHVGDSRVYRLRGRQFEQLTFDHSLVWEMSAAGHIPKDAVPSIVPKNVITRSLGPHPDVQVDLEGPFPIEVGDIFLLCSDGLMAGKLSDREIGAILQALPPAESARVLVDLANLRGGPDNITVIVVRITHPALATLPENQPGLLPIGEDLQEKKAKKMMSIVMWAAAVCFLILGLVLTTTSLPWYIPTIAFVAAAMFLGFGFLQLSTVPEPEYSYLPAGRMLGKGPHTRCECQPDGALSDDLARLAHELRDAATKGSWAIDWAKFNGYVKAGVEAADQDDFTTAVREYGRALRTMMAELRNQRQRAKPDDSEVDLLGK
ncbi:MAG: protein phosphatase 2C domain-containing protein [Pirellulales bacterium]|nr:protein phosphatase 2C domain-containing protein [Pirellulales bacterium]